MEPLNFSDKTEEDLIAAQDSCLEAITAIRDLQGTDLWAQLPIETRRLICGAHAHMCTLSDTINESI